MTAEQLIMQDLNKTIKISCPVCQKRGNLKIPTRIVEESKNLTTISVPKGIICGDIFQAIVDKNFQVRGYQKADFEVNNIEYMDDEVDIFTSKEKFNKIKTILRKSVRKNNIIGIGLYTKRGRMIFSSIPYDNSIQIIKDIEVRNNLELIQIKKLYIELENSYKIFLKIINIDKPLFILMVMFSELGTAGIGNLVLDKISTEINNSNKSF